MPALDDSASTANPSPIESTSPSSPQVAGKKRKATGTNVRGVASLTSEQLAKKRANDREAQRAIRERTKTQFETLERKIQDLTSQRPYQELQAVLRQKQAIQEENTEIKRTLASVLSIIQPIVGAHGLTGTGCLCMTRLTTNLPQNCQQLRRRAMMSLVLHPWLLRKSMDIQHPAYRVPP